MHAPITVLATRGDIVEARHRVHAVVVEGERRVLVAGDAELVTFLQLIREADSGAPSRAGSTGPRRRAGRDGVRVTPGSA